MTRSLLGLAALLGLTLGVVACRFPGLTCCGVDYANDPARMSDGNNNITGLGGYWWTYVDRSGTSWVHPDTGKVDPNDPTSTELNPGFAKENGIEADGPDNLAMRVYGSVGPVPLEVIPDTYWNTLHGSNCSWGDCGVPLVPSAGVGFGFKAANEPLKVNGTATRGLAFRIKLGTNHEGFSAGSPRPIRLLAPMDVTDAPDPSFKDKFGSSFIEDRSTTYYNEPLCGFPRTLSDNAPVEANATCFCHFGVDLPAPGNEWKTYCVSWTALVAPDCPGLALASYPEGGITQLIPERLIKILFDAYRPQAAESAANFDFWLDDVWLLDSAPSGTSSWNTHCGANSGAVVLR